MSGTPVSATNWFSPAWNASDVADYSGVIPNTGPATTAPPDGSGGAGSFVADLRNTLTSGISTLLSEKISAGLALTQQRDLRAVNAQGNVTAKAQQQADNSLLAANWKLYGGLALGVIVLAVIAKKALK